MIAKSSKPHTTSKSQDEVNIPPKPYSIDVEKSKRWALSGYAYATPKFKMAMIYICKKADCEHNIKALCYRLKITIDRKGRCEDFVRRRKPF